VGAFAATGLGVSTGHETLQHGFYESVFIGGVDRLGPASMAAKLNLYQAGFHPDLLHTFTVFGDPALQFDIQKMELVYLPLLGRE